MPKLVSPRPSIALLLAATLAALTASTSASATPSSSNLLSTLSTPLTINQAALQLQETQEQQQQYLSYPATGTTTPSTGGAACTITLPADLSVKDDWDFCCLQEYGAPYTALSEEDDEGALLVALTCEVRGEYAGALRGCFGEFAGVSGEGVVCVEIEEGE